MTDKRYIAAGWLAIALAVFLPLLLALGFGQSFVGSHMMGVGEPELGIHTLVTVAIAAVIIFNLLTLKKLLKDRYSFMRADRIILIAVIWFVVFTIGSMLMMFFADTTWPAPDEQSLYAIIAFFILSMTSAGVIYIFLGLRLLRIGEKQNQLMKVFAMVTLIMGILDLTVVLSPLTLVLTPVWCVTAAMVFLREKDEAHIL
jgi:hypothetical protein